MLSHAVSFPHLDGQQQQNPQLSWSLSPTPTTGANYIRANVKKRRRRRNDYYEGTVTQEQFGKPFVKRSIELFEMNTNLTRILLRYLVEI